ncbi:type II toxin-antitoxin system RelE/ParE family toxin [Mangrovivirga halotolerans]|uniref:type II toxin-antitoxin system RelE/ParE family toxin n=1 Tax=Mangrovivirga halotolerans TaxID=2993936 RepID=UPI0034E268E3
MRIFQVSRIKESTKSLKEFPKSGRIVPEIGNEDIRELIEGNYRIIYRIKNSERIDILTVYSSYRILKIDKII